MNKSMVVIYHVEDQAVWISDIKIYPYTQAGISEAISFQDTSSTFDLSTCVYILSEEEANSLYNELMDMPSEYDVYEYMRLNSNDVYLDEVRIE